MADEHVAAAGQQGAHVGAARVPPLLEGLTIGQAGDRFEGGRGVLRPIDAATVELAPGVSAHHSPGHTPGHYVVRVFSNDETSYLLGDVVHHPLQLNDQDISFLSEAEPERALRVRTQEKAAA